MRTPIMAGNWKMHNTTAEATKLALAIKAGLTDEMSGVDVVVCPTFTSLSAVAQAVDGSDIKVGAQNMHWADHGAYTGEISVSMLQETCEYVILGHSERREYFGETDEGVNKKARVALANGLTPIICCGENLAQNEAGETVSFVGSQIKGALVDMTAAEVKQLVIAYEPIWAIGTGRAAEPAAVNQIIVDSIRGTIAALYDDETAQAVRIQYGGSVKPANVDSFMAQPDIDGGLVGGASLTAENFLPLVASAAKHS